MREPGYYLLNRQNNVVAEITDEPFLAEINRVTILVWQGRNYIYSHTHQNGGLTFFVEVGEQVTLADEQLTIREGVE